MVFLHETKMYQNCLFFTLFCICMRVLLHVCVGAHMGSLLCSPYMCGVQKLTLNVFLNCYPTYFIYLFLFPNHSFPSVLSYHSLP